MKTAAQLFPDEIAELRQLAADYKAMQRDVAARLTALQRERRELVDVLFASCDVLTLERVLAVMERHILVWERWPQSRE